MYLHKVLVEVWVGRQLSTVHALAHHQPRLCVGWQVAVAAGAQLQHTGTGGQQAAVDACLWGVCVWVGVGGWGGGLDGLTKASSRVRSTPPRHAQTCMFACADQPRHTHNQLTAQCGDEVVVNMLHHAGGAVEVGVRRLIQPLPL